MNVQQTNLALLKALQIDATRVRKVVLIIQANEVPKLEITRLLVDADGIDTAIERLQLVPKVPE